MRIYKGNQCAYIEKKGHFFELKIEDWANFINRENLYQSILKNISRANPIPENIVQEKSGAPIDTQEVWAAGVTYLKSKEARMREAELGEGASHYAKVYDADRPEIFFKATPARTVGNGERIYIRRDSTWNVPEPELTLFVNSKGQIQAYTIGNDVSSRSIEGENPLYLPQAKTYERCAALGPCLYLSDSPISLDTKIFIEIWRNAKLVYSDQTQISNMKRSLEELVHYLFRACDFPNGVFLMTGTCLVPPDDFSLQLEDEVKISIDHIGTLVNTVGMKGA